MTAITKPQLIQSSTDMDALLSSLDDCSLIAVDTEFFRETSYYPQLALVQIATESVIACIDPLAFDARDALKKLFLEPDVTKIFHSCSQDMEVLYYYLGQTPVSIYDTQIANALLNEHHQIGYASLVERELGVKLDKSQTRTNWLQRPLTDKQLAYAGDDVLYLYQLHEILDERLIRSNRKSWFDEDNFRMIDQLDDFQVDTRNLWRRVKGTNRLPRKKLALIQAIAEWREQLAQQEDKTRRRVLADDIVLRLADEAIDSHDSLEQAIGSRYNFKESSLRALLTAIKNASNSSPETWPDNSFTVLDSGQKALLKSLQRSINDKADELGVSNAILSSKKELERLMLSARQEHAAPEHTEQKHDENTHGDTTQSSMQKKPSILTDIEGWRYHQFGQQLLNIISEATENAK